MSVYNFSTCLKFPLGEQIKCFYWGRRTIWKVTNSDLDLFTQNHVNMEEVQHYSHNRLDINHINKENNIIRECKQWYRTDSWFLPDPSCVTPSRTTHAKNVSQCVNERVYWSPQGNSFIAFPPAQEVQRSGSVTHQCPCSWHGFRVSLESIWAGQMLVNMDTVSGSSRENIVCLTPRSGVSKLRDLWLIQKSRQWNEAAGFFTDQRL